MSEKTPDKLPKGLSLGSYNGEPTYLESCDCESTWCHAPTVFFHGSNEVCLPQTKEVRRQQSVCAHFEDIDAFEQQGRWSNEAMVHNGDSSYGYFSVG